MPIMIENTNNRYKAIHFDMDGVIADTEALHVQAEQQTCRDHGIAIDTEKWTGFKGQTADAIFTHIVSTYDSGVDNRNRINKLIEYKTDVVVDLIDSQLHPVDGIFMFINWARKKFDTVSLVTSSNRRVQQRIIGRMGLSDYFDTIVTGDDVQHGKPHPEPYLRSLQMSQTKPEQSIVIEDSKSGIASASAAGCAVLAIATSHPADELSRTTAQYVATSYDHAIQLLSQ